MAACDRNPYGILPRDDYEDSDPDDEYIVITGTGHGGDDDSDILRGIHERMRLTGKDDAQLLSSLHYLIPRKQEKAIVTVHKDGTSFELEDEDITVPTSRLDLYFIDPYRALLL